MMRGGGESDSVPLRKFRFFYESSVVRKFL